MKVAATFKLPGLCAVGVGTWILTTTILGHNGRPARAADDGHARPVVGELANAGRGTERVGDLPTTCSSRRWLLRPAATRATDISQELKSYDVRITGRTVLVRAVANISDPRQGIRYLWDLDVMDSREVTPIQRTIYKNQMFFPTGEQARIHPSFQEVLTLDPGTYRVILRLHAIPADVNPEALGDRSQIKRWEATRGNREVIIAR